MATVEEIKEIIIESGVIGNVNEMKDHLSLRDQGVDSLDLLNVYFMIEEKYDISIPEEDIEQLKSINDIIDYIEKALS